MRCAPPRGTLRAAAAAACACGLLPLNALLIADFVPACWCHLLVGASKLASILNWRVSMQLSTADTTACDSRRQWEGVSGEAHTPHTHTVRATFDSLKFDTPVASVCKCVFATCDTKGDSSNEQRLCSLPASWPLFVCSTDLTCLCPCLHSFLSVSPSVCLCVCRALPATFSSQQQQRQHHVSISLCASGHPLPILPSLSLSLFSSGSIPPPPTLFHICVCINF